MTKKVKSKAKKEKVNPILEDENTDEVGKAEVEEQGQSEETSIPKQAEKPVVDKKETPKKNVNSGDVVKYHQDRIARTREKLMNGPMTNFFIPLEPGEKPGAYETVDINGWRLVIRKGALVNIPVPVMKILTNYYNVQTEAGRDKRIDRSEFHEGISVFDALN